MDVHRTKRPLESRKREKRRAEPRKRRTAEEARAAILDAAEQRLVAYGPGGIRLQDVAADIGVSHPTVLHHFGSREALVREVCERRFLAIHNDLVTAMATSGGGAEELGALIDSVSKAIRKHGHGRAVFWLALEGLLGKDERAHLVGIGAAAHDLRTRKRKGRAAPLDDTLYSLALSTLALLAESVIGEKILTDLGLDASEAGLARFRAWMSRLLADHLEHGPR